MQGEPRKIDKTIIVLDSLPYGDETAETLVHPMMEDYAANFTMEEPVPPETPTAPVATWTKLPTCLNDRVVGPHVFEFGSLGLES